METTNTSKAESAPSINPFATFASELMENNPGTGNIFTPAQIRSFAQTQAVDIDELYKYVINPTFRHGRGKYDMSLPASGKMPSSVKKTKARKTKPAAVSPKASTGLQEPAPAEISTKVEPTALKLHTHDTTEEVTYVPDVDKTYVRWGAFKDIAKIIESRQFFPIYISGPSGNGKTFMVEQSVAKAKRQFIRVQLTPETDEDDLLGGFRLIEGNTIFCKGPVIRAMEEGSIIVLDEIDRATNKIMCLQSVLEGKAVFLKKTGETVHPRPGFQVIATANTRGRGCVQGRYTAASIIDDAFLERFPITMNQTWASKATERKIVLKHMTKFDCMDEDFAEKLVNWSHVIRETYKRDGIDEEISTRRICHAVQTFGIFQDRMDAVRLICNRFDDDVAEAFIDLYTKVDSGAIVVDDEGDESSDDPTPKPIKSQFL